MKRAPRRKFGRSFDRTRRLRRPATDRRETIPCLPGFLLVEIDLCIATTIVRTLGCACGTLERDSVLADLGANDLDVEEIVDACETAMGLPEESVWERVTGRPSRLTVEQISKLFVSRLAEE